MHDDFSRLADYFVVSEMKMFYLFFENVEEDCLQNIFGRRQILVASVTLQRFEDTCIV